MEYVPRPDHVDVLFQNLASSIQLVHPACRVQEDPMYGVYFVVTPTKRLVLVGPQELQEMLVAYGVVGEQALINAVLSANRMQQIHRAQEMLDGVMTEIVRSHR